MPASRQFSLYLFILRHPSHGLRAGARLCVVSRRNDIFVFHKVPVKFVSGSGVKDDWAKKLKSFEQFFKFLVGKLLTV